MVTAVNHNALHVGKRVAARLQSSTSSPVQSTISTRVGSAKVRHQVLAADRRSRVSLARFCPRKRLIFAVVELDNVPRLNRRI